LKSKIKVDKRKLKHLVWENPFQMNSDNNFAFFPIQPMIDYIDDVVWFVADDITVAANDAMQIENIDSDTRTKVVQIINDYVSHTYV
jgi:hypothetical protein